MKRLPQRLLILVLCVFLFTLPAISLDNPVDDLAGVFSSPFVYDLTSFAKSMETDLGIPLTVLTRHFLGGKNIQAFAEDTLKTLPDAEKAILFVLVIGEENYAVAIGGETRKILDPVKAEALLNDHFRSLYLGERAYEKATAAFLTEAGAYLETRTGRAMKGGNALTKYVREASREIVLPTLAPNTLDDIMGSVFEDANQSVENARRYGEDAREAEEPNRGLSLFQIALIGFILYRIFGRKNRFNKSNQRKGCGPLGWIFGAWGVSKFFGWRK